MSEYETQAQEFLTKTNTTIKADFVGYKKHFVDDKEKRDVYKVTFTRGERSFFVMFGQSLNCSGKFRYLDHVNNDFKELKKVSGFHSLKQVQCSINKEQKPVSAYDVLTCLQKSDVGSFKDFCSDFGYDDDSLKAHKTYKLVVEEYKNVLTLWSDEEIDLLQEIQ